MALQQLRRVITGHDATGRAIVHIDEINKNTFTGRPGATGINVWTTEGFPVNNDGQDDGGQRKAGTTVPNGTIFRILEFAPGLAARNHRTDSIDYIVVLSGEIDMELDDSTVHIKAGDVMVQRGTIHNWVNRGTEPCRLAVILIAAKPVRSRRQDAERRRLDRAVGSNARPGADGGARGDSGPRARLHGSPVAVSRFEPGSLRAPHPPGGLGRGQLNRGRLARRTRTD